MNKIFSTEKILIHNENMDFIGVKTRILLFGKIVISYHSKTNLNTI